MVYVWLMFGIAVCAIQAVRATPLLLSALWLAGASVLVAIVLFALGAREVAVIELSVGAGLVTVLLVYTIAIAGADAIERRSSIPWLLALALVGISIFLLAQLALPLIAIPVAATESTFKYILWQQRSPDVLAQIVLLFLGAIGVAGLLAGDEPAPTADERRLAAGDEDLRAGASLKTSSSPIVPASEPETTFEEVEV